MTATAEQREGLYRQARRANQEADGARGILLSLSGWRNGEALRVREDAVRNWRLAFMRKGLQMIVRHPAPDHSPVKAEVALAVAREVLATPVENRINWTLKRLSADIERPTGQRISRSRLSVVLGPKGDLSASGPATS